MTRFERWNLQPVHAWRFDRWLLFASNTLAWLAGLALALPAHAAIPASERQVLLDLYTSTNGQEWTINRRWNGAPGTECSWYGITCDESDTHVTEIHLEIDNLSGSLPSLGGLTNLQILRVDRNSLTGSIPPLAGLTNLTDFDVDGNQLSGAIPPLAGLTNLQNFHADGNQLSGAIPALTGLTNLQYFYVAANQLSGSIPSLGGLTNLQYFYVADNQLSGSIPSLAGLTNLEFFEVGGNQLTGSIPSLTGLTSLNYFQITGNRLSGPVPSLAGLASLQYFYIDLNQLSGDIPDVPNPDNLVNHGSVVCPNAFNHTPNAGWDAATGYTPWYRDCSPPSLTLGVTSVSPSSAAQGTIVQVTLIGTGLDSTTRFDFGSGVTVGGYLIADEETARLMLTIAPSATPGARTVTATRNQDGATASLLDGFAVNAANDGQVLLHAIASSPGPYGIGDNVTYTLGVTNSSDSDVGGLTVTADVPSQLSISSVQCDASASNGALTWPIGTLGAGANATCTFEASVVALDPVCQSNCQIAVNVTAHYDGGQSRTQAVVGTLVPPQPESTTVSGVPTTEPSEKPSLSADGSLVIFQSLEKDLVSGSNTNPGGADIYLHDRRNGQTTLISRDASGSQMTGNLHDAQVSLNGQAAVFVRDPAGAAAAKDAGMSSVCYSNPNGLFQFVCPTTGMNGAPIDGESESPSMSADGKLMAFCSAATNLVAGDTNNARDVFVRTVATGQVSRVSVTADGTQGNGDSCAPMISGDGQYVVFTTTAENLGGASTAQVVRKDLMTGAILQISQSASGTPGDADAGPPSISADGQRIAFASRASNLVPGVGGGRRNAFIYDGRPGSGQSSAKHLRKSGAVSNAGLGVILADGGQQPNEDMDDPKIACGGGAVSLTSAASNLVEGDTNGVSDYFVYGLDSATIVRPAPLATGDQPNGPSQNAALDCEATAGGYDSNATGPGNPNTNTDVIGQNDPLRSDASAITLDSSYSGNWFDPGQNGHGFLLEALPVEHGFYATWYVFQNGQPLFLQGVGTSQGNTLVVDMDSTTSSGFPVGADGPVHLPWGRVTFTFTSSDDGTVSWQPVAPGFTAGTMNLRRLSHAALVESNRAGATDACLSGIWYDPNNSGYGFDLEFNDADNGQRIVQTFWYTYQPDGAPLWLSGLGFGSGNTIDMDLVQLGGSGANFPPAFVADSVSATPWGHVTLRFDGTSRLSVDYNSTLPGYGSGTLDLQRLSVLAGRQCSG